MGDRDPQAYKISLISDARWQAIRAERRRQIEVGRELWTPELAAEAIADYHRRHGPDPHATTGILHGDFGPRCLDCAGVSDVLCDFPVGKGKTCDRAICEECAPEIGTDLHYCTAHREEWERFRRDGMTAALTEQRRG